MRRQASAAPPEEFRISALPAAAESTTAGSSGTRPSSGRPVWSIMSSTVRFMRENRRGCTRLTTSCSSSCPSSARGVCRAGGVPQGGGIRRGSDDTAVGKLRGKAEARADPGGRVDQDPVEGLAGLAQQRTEALLLHESVLLAHRGRQQEQARQGRMLRGVGQLAEALRHVRERDSGLLSHAERDVEIPQADVGIDAQDALSLGRQDRPRSRRRASFFPCRPCRK